MTSTERPAGSGLGLTEERERLADRREGLADERERLADERDRLADERELRADDRDRRAHERDLRSQPRPSGEAPDIAAVRAVRGSRRRLAQSEENLESARLALARSRSLLDRQRVGVETEENDAGLQELAIEREMLISRSAAEHPT